MPLMKKVGRAVHAAAHAAEEVLLHPIRVDVVGQVPVEQPRRRARAFGVGTEVVVVQALLVLVEQVVHLPELALGGRGLGRLRRVLGVRRVRW